MLELLACQLILGGYGHNSLDALDRTKRLLQIFVFVIRHVNCADHCVLSAGHVGAEAKFLQASNDVVALGLGSPDLQDDYHVACPSPAGAGIIMCALQPSAPLRVPPVTS